MPELNWSIFGSHAADRILREKGEWSDLIDRVRSSAGHRSKQACPWVKMALFGDLRTGNNSLRHDSNVQVINGVEGDYDSELIQPEEAIAQLERYGVRAMVYTSPSHTPDKPRWRVIAPLSIGHPPSARSALMARINGVLGGVLAPESFTLSQSYYFGAVQGAAEYKVLVTFDDPEDGHCVDTLDELDGIAIGRETARAATPSSTHDSALAPADPADAFEQRVRQLGRKLKTGDGRREMLKSYVASRSARGVRGNDLLTLVRGIAATYFEPADPINERDIQKICAWANDRDLAAAQEAARIAAGIMPSVVVSVAEPESLDARMAEFKQAKADEESVPDHLLQLPGVMGECYQWMLRTAQRRQPLLSLAATVSLFSTVLSTKIQSPTKLRTNLYLVAVAGTASGKDHGRNCVSQVMQVAQLENLLGGDEIGSGAGLLTRLMKSPRSLFQLDEFGLMLQAMRSKTAGSHLASIMRYLMQLYGMTGTSYRGAEYANQKDRPRADIDFPCVNLHATTTPDQFFSALGSADVTSGALNRMLILVTPDRIVPRQESEPEDPPESLIQWVQTVQRLQCGMRGLTPSSPLQMRYDSAAKELIRGFSDWLDAQAESCIDRPQIPALWGRAYEMAVKLAMIHAMALHEDLEQLERIATNDSLTITGPSMAWGISFVKTFMGRTQQELESRMGDSDFDILVQRVAKQIKEAGPAGLTVYELSRKCAAYKSKEPRVQDMVHVALIRRQDAIQVRFTPASGGAGRPRLAWVAWDYTTKDQREQADAANLQQ